MRNSKVQLPSLLNYFFLTAFCFLVPLICSCNGSSQDNRKLSIQSELDEVFSEGEQAPVLKLVDFSGKERTLDEFKGKFILLNFWASWCVPCVKELPELEDLQRKQISPDFQVVSINVDAPGAKNKVTKLIETHNLTFPVLLDPELLSFEKFRLSGLPETFFISPEGSFIPLDDPLSGKKVLRILSDREWSSETFIEAIKKASSTAKQDES